MKRLPRYQLAIFDMDGTIIDSRIFHAAVFEELFHENWHTVDYETCYQAVGQTVRTVFESVGIPAERHEFFYQQLDCYYGKKADIMLQRTRLADGIIPVLQKMRSFGMKIAVVSNSLNAVVDLFLTYHGIRGMFDLVVGADEQSHTKNDRCREVVRMLGSDTDEVLYIGDTESDMQMANEMCYDACFAKTEIAWYKDERYITRELRPRYTISDYGELLFILGEDA